jgi:methylenetetrahydrofolate dehydrogenase (NADP+)/methenyltetrahydrofolate cyclohydrolase
VATETKISLKELLQGKNCLIINRSLIIGKPIAPILLTNNATITIAHSKSENVQEMITKSQIVISATGKSGFLNQFKFSPNTIIIDAGFNLIEGKVQGDVIVDDKFGENISYLSAVPGGVGPIGVACLLENTVLATKKNSNMNSTDLA